MIVKPVDRKYMGGMKLPAGIEPEEWDAFHNIVAIDELNRYIHITQCGGANLRQKSN